MADLSDKTVAIIVADFIEDAELTTPRDSLRESGATVRIYSVSGETVQTVEGDTDPKQKIDVDGSLDDLDVDAIDAVVVPGGTINADKLRIESRAQTIVRKVAGAGKPLAVICHGPWLLVSADLVEGRRLTSYHSLAEDVRNAGGQWVDEEVVVDRNLITSRNPDDLPAFVKALEDALALSLARPGGVETHRMALSGRPGQPIGESRRSRRSRIESSEGPAGASCHRLGSTKARSAASSSNAVTRSGRRTPRAVTSTASIPTRRNAALRSTSLSCCSASRCPAPTYSPATPRSGSNRSGTPTSAASRSRIVRLHRRVRPARVLGPDPAEVDLRA